MEFEQEVTVELDCDLDSFKTIMKNYNFEIKEEYSVNDIYMVRNDCDIKDNPLEVLKKCVLIRDIVEQDVSKQKITYKYKEYSDNGDILKQGKVDCSINSIKEAKSLLEVIGYKELIRINDSMIVFANNEDEFVLQQVNDKHLYIEIEEESHYIDNKYENIDAMKNVILKYSIPIKNNDYFVKKAAIELIESIK